MTEPQNVDDKSPPPLAAGELPESLSAALYDLVQRHDALGSVSPAAARAFLARLLDRRAAGPLDLDPLAMFLEEHGASDEVIHEVTLSLAALAPALKERASLPKRTAALSSKERQEALQRFVTRCPRRLPAEALPTLPEGGMFSPDPDYLLSVVTSVGRRRRRRRLLAIAAGVLGAAALTALGLWLWEARRGDASPPVHREHTAGRPVALEQRLDAKQARVLARVQTTRAEEALARGDLGEASGAAKQALALDEGMADALRVLAVAEKRAGRGAEACRLMRDYVTRAETPEPARARLLQSACDDAPSP